MSELLILALRNKDYQTAVALVRKAIKDGTLLQDITHLCKTGQFSSLETLISLGLNIQEKY